MGDIAELMIEGVLCETCGDYLGGPTGFPRRCSACRGEASPPKPRRQRRTERMAQWVAKKRAEMEQKP